MEKVNKEKDIKQIVEAISNATEEKTDYMVAWLDGWECCKNALKAGVAPGQKEANA